jgi:hypothetical protein|tara:strand:- start:55 stop:573 length:519 start_codon:yes stop_codon:yes gene_type:complete
VTKQHELHAHNPSHVFRLWQYFRVGWATYFGFIFAALNTIITTYYLAIDNVSFLQQVFPTFGHYVISVILIGIPALIGVGYIHTKRTSAYREEAKIQVETNPHAIKNLENKELMLLVVYKINELLIKKINKNKFTAKEFQEMNTLKQKIQDQNNCRTLSNIMLTDIDNIIKE